jgi:serine phosphatase RsbU (regulator of sigma subunit)
MSGDFFDTFPVPDQAVGLIVCDVMGPGVCSALITAMIRAMVEQFHALAADPAAYLTRLNHDLTKMLRRETPIAPVTACCSSPMGYPKPPPPPARNSATLG